MSVKRPKIAFIALPLALTFSYPAVVLGLNAAYTDTSRGCRTLRQDSSVRVWRCMGPASYAAVFSDEGNVVGVEYGPVGKEKDLGGLQWRAGDPPMGPQLEWRISASGKPFAAIMRINTRDENGRSREQLLIAKVGPEGGCRIELMDARLPKANMRARSIADKRGTAHICP